MKKNKKTINNLIEDKIRRRSISVGLFICMVFGLIMYSYYKKPASPILPTSSTDSQQINNMEQYHRSQGRTNLIYFY